MDQPFALMSCPPSINQCATAIEQCFHAPLVRALLKKPAAAGHTLRNARDRALVMLECVGEVADVWLVLRVVVDRHDIELARQVFEVLGVNEVVCHAGKLPALARINRIFGMAGHAGLGFDFYETDDFISQRDNVEFAHGATEIPGEDLVAAFLQKADGIALGTACNCPALPRHRRSTLNAGEFALLFARFRRVNAGLRPA